jgi:hypothetical protein
MELTIIVCRAAAAEALCISRYADVCSFRAQASLERYATRFGDGEDLLIDLLSSPFFYRIFITGHRVEPDLAEKLVDFVLLRDIPKKSGLI